MKIKLKEEYEVYTYNARESALKVLERFASIGYHPSQKSVENCLASSDPKYSRMIRMMNTLNMIESEK
jgi:hypothetical protein